MINIHAHKTVSISKIKPYDKNTRTHSVEQLAEIKASIETFGFTNPLLVDNSMEVIAGHGRLEAAKELKMTKLPVVVVECTPEQAKALRIADNRIPLNAGWDSELLALEIGELVDQEFDISVLGFEDAEIQKLLDAPPDDIDDDDDAPFGDPVIQYNIIFDTVEQQKRWFDFVRHVKELHPEAETFAEALDSYLTENP